MLTCIIRYQIDPTKRAEFEQYARTWGQAIPRCGADLIGYFAPHEGSSILAYGVYNIENLNLTALANDQVYEFAFIFSPLRLKGATGSPATPTSRWRISSRALRIDSAATTRP